MNANARQRLRDALLAAELLAKELNRQTQDGFLSDPWFRAATERQLEIIGEALNHVRREEPSAAEQFPTIHEWVALRNVLSHLYDRVDLQIIWDTVNDDISPLIDTLHNLLGISPDDDQWTGA